MNSTFKVVFNRARGALMVVNEVTSSVQSKGSKTVIAAAIVTALGCGVVSAAEHNVDKDGYLETTAENSNRVFSSADVLNLTGNAIYGLKVNGADQTYTNDGTINVNAYGASGMQAVTGGTLINNGTINVANGKAITVSSANDAQIKLTADSVTNGTIYVGGTSKNTIITVDEGAVLGGQIRVRPNGEGVSGTKLSGVLNVNGVQNKTNGLGGVISFYDGDNSSIFLRDSNFINNRAEGSLRAYGGVIYTYATTFSQHGGSYIGNQVFSTDGLIENSTVVDGALGGALMIKGNIPVQVTFSNVLFQNNSATATGVGFAYGGAILADYSTGNNGDIPGSADLIFNVNSNNSLTYSGNTVSSSSSATFFDTYGYHVHTAAAGGFLFLDRGATALFNVEEGSTLTIGSDVTTDDTDSIASSIPNKGTGTNSGKHALLKKEGAGTLTVNSSLNKYYGTFDVNAGRLEVNSQWDFKNAVNVASGATLALADFNLLDADKTQNIDKDGNQLAGNLIVAGTLETSSAQVFTQGLNAAGTTESADSLKYDAQKLTFQDGSTLALTDSLYNLKYAQSASDLLSGKHVVLLGDLIDADKGEIKNESSLAELDNVGPNTTLAKVTVTEDSKNIQIGGTNPNADDVAYRADSLSVGAISLGTKDTVTIEGGKTLSLAGNGGEVVSADNGAVVKVNDGTLALGGVASMGGTLSNVELGTAGTVAVTGTENFTLESVKGDGTVVVGAEDAAGDVTINSIAEMTGGQIRFDSGLAGTSVHDGVKGSIYGLDQAFNTEIAVESNAIVASDAAADDAVSAFEAIAAAQNLSWNDQVTSAFYAGAHVNLETGSITIGGSDAASAAVALFAAVPYSGTPGMTIGDKGMLIVNQSIDYGTSVVEGDLTFAADSYLGVTNAAVGELQLGTTVTDNGVNVVTDNPFIIGSVTDNKLTNRLDVESGLGALASTGIQAMTHRADFMMSETVADRTSIDQEMSSGLNLWVDVSGERYEADRLDRNADFRADMGYAAFGADIALTDTFTAGAAMQYGTGSLRSDVASIKNEIESYGVTAYAAQKFGAAKLVGEIAYLQSQNELSSSMAALNQDVDAKVYSAGIRAQYQITAGKFQFVPSIGLRVSRLETDAMNIGTIRVDDQEQTLVQMPIALRVNGFEQNLRGWSVAPSLKVAYVPTFGDKEISFYGYDQDVINTNPVQADFGIRAMTGNMMLNADMMVGGGENGTSSIGAKVGMKYVF